ncbi:hypothetical protein L914_20912 [Phytophthora nicotianae]|uniref:Uncharacterized protein n=1 Tax=Phytophthora nicotianae TaxID=4792 RepID=W2M7K4_PHYNI|nr:hypothetical protein L914_20912 [Phytophthora nicotianae]
MVRANRPASAFTNAQISGFYFRRRHYGAVAVARIKQEAPNLI